MTEDLSTKGRHVADFEVGVRIRLRRRELGLSQEELAVAVGVTCQQIQKYERGENRVSASRLWEIGRALEVSTSYFFERLVDNDEGATVNTALAGFALSLEGAELIRHFPRLKKKQQRAVLNLMQGLFPD